MSLEQNCANPAFPLPIGSIMPYMGLANSIPLTFLPCNGQQLSRVDYPELFLTLGTTFNGTAVLPSGQFLLPKINDDVTYLVPNGTLKTDPARANGILAPVIHSSSPFASPALTAANIPTMTGSNFTQTYPNNQIGLQGRTMNGLGDKSVQFTTAKTGSSPASSPFIIPQTVTKRYDGSGSMTTADYTYENPTPTPVGNIVLNDDHVVQYGGMTCIYIIKAFSSYTPSASKNASINEGLLENAVYVAGVAAQKAAEATSIALADAQNDQRAIDEATALDNNGQGGGTEYPYATVPQLEGYRMPPTSPY